MISSMVRITDLINESELANKHDVEGRRPTAPYYKYDYFLVRGTPHN